MDSGTFLILCCSAYFIGSSVILKYTNDWRWVGAQLLTAIFSWGLIVTASNYLPSPVNVFLIILGLGSLPTVVIHGIYMLLAGPPGR